MTGDQQATLELCGDEAEQHAAANGGRVPAVDVDLGDPAKLSVLAFQPASRLPVVVGPVYSDKSAEKLRDQVVAAGLADVRIVREMSASDFRDATGKKP